MLLKRYLALAAGVLIFIFVYIVYFAYAHHQMENRFREERAKFGIDDGAVLTASTSTASAPSAATNAANGSSPASGATPSDATPTEAPIPSPTPNPLIGPLPPPSTSTPDSTPAPATPTPDPSAAPTAPPSSTMNDREESRSPFLVLAAYHPSQGMIQMAGVAPTPAMTPTPSATPTGSPATNAPNPTSVVTPTPLTGTNTAPFASSVSESNTPRPVPVEASVIVLLYHQFVPAGVHISPKLQWTLNQDVFESEMKYIHDNGYHVVPISDVLKFLKHEIGLPPNSVAITIDDGYKSAIVYAAPILKKYGYPWTYFIYPDFITVNEGSGAASWNDLLALQAEGVDIESHSMTHPQLSRKVQKFKGSRHLLSPEEYDEWLTNETLGSKKLLEQKMGKTINCFAYPYGDYNKQVQAKVIDAGYEAIFTVADNPVHATTDLHSIGRYTITQSVVKNFAAYLRQGALGIAEADPAPGATITNPRPTITAVLGYAGNIDPKSIETSVLDFGVVRHDYDPKTSTIRLYLPRDLIQSTVKVNIRVKDAESGQVMVANWHFNYEPGSAAPLLHPPLVPETNSASASTNAPAATTTPTPSIPTNAPTVTASPMPTPPESARQSAQVPIPAAPVLSPH